MNDPLKETLIRAYVVASFLIEDWKKNGVQDRTFTVLLNHLEKAVDDHETVIQNRSSASLSPTLH